MRLLLIDTRVSGYQTFINACREDVKFIAYDYYTETYEDLKSKIQIILDSLELDESKDLDSVGFIAHNYMF
jgi:hypothetical protein